MRELAPSAVQAVAGHSPGDPEAEYFQTIEEFFVSRRGAPLFLSSRDWHVARKWRRAAIPLRVVLRGITDALDAHAHSWSRERKVVSLAYCASEVQAAQVRWQRALALGTDEPSQIDGFLDRLSAALASARGLAAAVAVVRDGVVAGVSERRGAGVPAAALDTWLQEREGELVGALRKAAAPAALAELEAEVERDLQPYRERLPPPVLTQVRSEGLRRRLIEAAGLPRLSLFHAE